MKRILYIEPSGNLWGSERSLAALLNHLDPQHYDAALCLPPHKPMMELIEAQALTVYPCLDDLLHKKSKLQKSLSYLRLYQKIKAFRPQILHLNQAGLSNAVARIANQLALPLVIHVRLHEEAKLVAQACQYAPQLHCVAISNFVKQELIQAGVPDAQIHTITNPVVPSKAPLGTALNVPDSPSGAPIIGFVGRLTPDKGIDCFIEAAEVVCQSNAQAQFWIVGNDGGHTTPDNEPYQQYWETQVVAKKLDSRIHFLGFRKQATQIMHHFTAMAMPSTAEPWGRVLAEAMSVGTPVIASRSGASEEIITHEQNGVLFPPRDAQSLAQAILRILENNDFRKQLSENGKQWVQEHCSAEKHVAAITALYNRALSLNNKVGP